MKIIAEAGVNHNGSLDLAVALVHAAAEAGADYVKFQSFKTSALVTESAKQADYQARNLSQIPTSQSSMLQALELSESAHVTLRDLCLQCGIGFLSTPFDSASASYLVEELGLDLVKVGSGDLDNLPLLVHLGRLGSNVILSTGMSRLGDIESSLGALSFGYTRSTERPSVSAFAAAYASLEGRAHLAQRVTLLHCTTEYPAPYDSLNLAAIPTLHHAFKLPVGFSDHSEGHEASVAALALGATWLEKHITLDRTMKGPDHLASLEPGPFGHMVKILRNMSVSLGDGVKRIMPTEIANRVAARKTVVASRAVEEGEELGEHNLTLKRAGGGGAPASSYYDLIGTLAARNYSKDETVP